jgi:hypothetical protein
MVLALTAATVILTGADTQPEPPVLPPVASPESAAAAQILDRAIETYSVPTVSWMEMTLWQQIWEDGVGRVVQGRYLAAPDHRLRLELKVQVNRTEGEFKLVSDGKSLWQLEHLGSGRPAVGQGYLPRLGEQYRTPEAVAAARTALLAEYTFLGPSPLLRILRRQAQRMGRKTVRWKGIEITQITGNWPEDPAKLADVPEYQRPRHPPRLWSVYLDAATLWPHRLEWWGAARPEDKPTLLLEMEFRGAVLNRPMSPERCAREFMVPPPDGR